MSLAAVLSVNDDTNIIVDNALARVREEARLDAEPVLPPLEVLLPARLQRKPLIGSAVFVPTPRPLPSPEAIVAEAAKQNSKSTTISTKRGPVHARSAARWPVLLCGFVASVFAGAAFMYSPVGQRPEVRRAVVVAKTEAAHLYQSTKHTAISIAR
jgi:hypothetical protein